MNLPSDETIRYFDQNADEYALSTVGIDMSAFYEPFLAMVSQGRAILDAGCGSGRDTKAFLDRGYAVTAFDASENMASLAAKTTGIRVGVRRLQDVDFGCDFDGVWASASLLHLPRADLLDAITRLAKALRLGGVLYASFKLGIGEQVADGRLFTYLSETELRSLLRVVPLLSLATLWTTADLRPSRSDRWLNVLATKVL